MQTTTGRRAHVKAKAISVMLAAIIEDVSWGYARAARRFGRRVLMSRGWSDRRYS
jgi:hypothetical protein